MYIEWSFTHVDFFVGKWHAYTCVLLNFEIDFFLYRMQNVYCRMHCVGKTYCYCLASKLDCICIIFKIYYEITILVVVSSYNGFLCLQYPSIFKIHFQSDVVTLIFWMCALWQCFVGFIVVHKMRYVCSWHTVLIVLFHNELLWPVFVHRPVCLNLFT